MCIVLLSKQHFLLCYMSVGAVDLKQFGQIHFKYRSNVIYVNKCLP